MSINEKLNGIKGVYEGLAKVRDKYRDEAVEKITEIAKLLLPITDYMDSNNILYGNDEIEKGRRKSRHGFVVGKNAKNPNNLYVYRYNGLVRMVDEDDVVDERFGITLKAYIDFAYFKEISRGFAYVSKIQDAIEIMIADETEALECFTSECKNFIESFQ
ncbi:hypothetical protein FACS1894120_6020 [Clostridia bacterium]|nr:hypothetical protein FACS1894120_6020 [Clostridia bacterium]